jgi:dGTPase
VVDLLEKRYEHPGLNLTDAVREGIAKSGAAMPPETEADDGLRARCPPPLEAQVVRLADRIAATLSDLDDALQSGVVDVARVERLRAVAALKRKLGTHYAPRAGRFMKANAIHRGLTHLLVTGAIVHAGRRLEAWSREHGVTDPERFAAVAAEAIGGDEVALPRPGEELLGELERFVERTVHRGHAADRVDALGRRMLLGLLAAYHRAPRLLEDHVLLRWKEVSGRRFLRDLDREDEASETAAMVRDVRYVRLLADHIAGMTDTYVRMEHARLLQAGAIPHPSVEQLRREEGE